MRRTQKQAFSLMEMMVVLVIVAIIVAVSAPMITRKHIRAIESKSPWVWTGANNSIGFNMTGNNGNNNDGTAQQAIIGSIQAPDGGRLSITSDTDNNIPQIVFGTGNGGASTLRAKLFATDDTISLSSNDPDLTNDENNVIIGLNSSADGDSCVVVGQGATASGENATALGQGATASQADTIAIGNSTASCPQGIAIGSGAMARRGNAAAYTSSSNIAIGEEAEVSRFYTSDAIAIGHGAKVMHRSINWTTGTITDGDTTNARHSDSIAIGHNANAGDDQLLFAANTYNDNQIAIGPNAWALRRKAIAIGPNAQARTVKSIAIGEAIANDNSASGDFGAIAIGGIDAYTTSSGNEDITETNNSRQTFANGRGSIAIGCGAQVGTSATSGAADSAIAIGGTYGHKKSDGTWTRDITKATGDGATAIGAGAQAAYNFSTAIGLGAKTSHSNQIVLGTNGDTVFIPGKLVVDGAVLLSNTSNEVYMRENVVNHNLFRFHKTIDNHQDGTSRVPLFEELNDAKAAFPKYFSDRRLKNVGKSFTGGLNEIRKLEVFNYTFKKDKDKTPRVGVMAQDLQKIFPNAVTKGEDGYLNIRMEDMFYALVNAVKELDTKLTAVMQDVKNVIADITGIKNKNEEQDKQIAELVKQNKAQQEVIAELTKRLDKLERIKK